MTSNNLADELNLVQTSGHLLKFFTSFLLIKRQQSTSGEKEDSSCCSYNGDQHLRKKCDRRKVLYLRAGWLHDWYESDAKSGTVVREKVRGPFATAQLVASTPFVLVNSSIQRGRENADAADEILNGRRGARLKTGIPDPWAEYLTFSAISKIKKRIHHREISLWSSHTNLTESLWHKRGLSFDQGIPDPWRNWPKSTNCYEVSKNKSKKLLTSYGDMEDSGLNNHVSPELDKKDKCKEHERKQTELKQACRRSHRRKCETDYFPCPYNTSKVNEERGTNSKIKIKQCSNTLGLRQKTLQKQPDGNTIIECSKPLCSSSGPPDSSIAASRDICKCSCPRTTIKSNRKSRLVKETLPRVEVTVASQVPDKEFEVGNCEHVSENNPLPESTSKTHITSSYKQPKADIHHCRCLSHRSTCPSVSPRSFAIVKSVTHLHPTHSRIPKCYDIQCNGLQDLPNKLSTRKGKLKCYSHTCTNHKSNSRRTSTVPVRACQCHPHRKKIQNSETYRPEVNLTVKDKICSTITEINSDSQLHSFSREEDNVSPIAASKSEPKKAPMSSGNIKTQSCSPSNGVSEQPRHHTCSTFKNACQCNCLKQKSQRISNRRQKTMCSCPYEKNNSEDCNKPEQKTYEKKNSEDSNKPEQKTLVGDCCCPNYKGYNHSYVPTNNIYCSNLKPSLPKYCGCDPQHKHVNPYSGEIQINNSISRSEAQTCNALLVDSITEPQASVETVDRTYILHKPKEKRKSKYLSLTRNYIDSIVPKTYLRNQNRIYTRGKVSSATPKFYHVSRKSFVNSSMTNYNLSSPHYTQSSETPHFLPCINNSVIPCSSSPDILYSHLPVPPCPLSSSALSIPEKLPTYQCISNPAGVPKSPLYSTCSNFSSPPNISKLRNGVRCSYYPTSTPTLTPTQLTRSSQLTCVPKLLNDSLQTKCSMYPCPFDGKSLSCSSQTLTTTTLNCCCCSRKLCTSETKNKLEPQVTFTCPCFSHLSYSNLAHYFTCTDSRSPCYSYCMNSAQPQNRSLSSYVSTYQCLKQFCSQPCSSNSPCSLMGTNLKSKHSSCSISKPQNGSPYPCLTNPRPLQPQSVPLISTSSSVFPTSTRSNILSTAPCSVYPNSLSENQNKSSSPCLLKCLCHFQHSLVYCPFSPGLSHTPSSFVSTNVTTSPCSSFPICTTQTQDETQNSFSSPHSCLLRSAFPLQPTHSSIPPGSSSHPEKLSQVGYLTPISRSSVSQCSTTEPCTQANPDSTATSSKLPYCKSASKCPCNLQCCSQRNEYVSPPACLLISQNICHSQCLSKTKYPAQQQSSRRTDFFLSPTEEPMAIPAASSSLDKPLPQIPTSEEPLSPFPSECIPSTSSHMHVQFVEPSWKSASYDCNSHHPTSDWNQSCINKSICVCSNNSRTPINSINNTLLTDEYVFGDNYLHHSPEFPLTVRIQSEVQFFMYSNEETNPSDNSKHADLSQNNTSDDHENVINIMNNKENIPEKDTEGKKQDSKKFEQPSLRITETGVQNTTEEGSQSDFSVKKSSLKTQHVGSYQSDSGNWADESSIDSKLPINDSVNSVTFIKLMYDQYSGEHKFLPKKAKKRRRKEVISREQLLNQKRSDIIQDQKSPETATETKNSQFTKVPIIMDTLANDTGKENLKLRFQSEKCQVEIPRTHSENLAKISSGLPSPVRVASKKAEAKSTDKTRMKTKINLDESSCSENEKEMLNVILHCGSNSSQITPEMKDFVFGHTFSNHSIDADSIKNNSLFEATSSGIIKAGKMKTDNSAMSERTVKIISAVINLLHKRILKEIKNRVKTEVSKEYERVFLNERSNERSVPIRVIKSYKSSQESFENNPKCEEHNDESDISHGSQNGSRGSSISNEPETYNGESNHAEIPLMAGSSGERLSNIAEESGEENGKRKITITDCDNESLLSTTHNHVLDDSQNELAIPDTTVLNATIQLVSQKDIRFLPHSHKNSSTKYLNYLLNYPVPHKGGLMKHAQDLSACTNLLTELENEIMMSTKSYRQSSVLETTSTAQSKVDITSSKAYSFLEDKDKCGHEQTTHLLESIRQNLSGLFSEYSDSSTKLLETPIIKTTPVKKETCLSETTNISPTASVERKIQHSNHLTSCLSSKLESFEDLTPEDKDTFKDKILSDSEGNIEDSRTIINKGFRMKESKMMEQEFLQTLHFSSEAQSSISSNSERSNQETIKSQTHEPNENVCNSNSDLVHILKDFDQVPQNLGNLYDTNNNTLEKVFSCSPKQLSEKRKLKNRELYRKRDHLRPMSGHLSSSGNEELDTILKRCLSRKLHSRKEEMRHFTAGISSTAEETNASTNLRSKEENSRRHEGNESAILMNIDSNKSKTDSTIHLSDISMSELSGSSNEINTYTY